MKVDFIHNREGKYLFKYLPFNQNALKLLINQEFWLGPPDLLNDPFEGDFIIENYKELQNEEFKKILIALLKNIGYEEIFDLVKSDDLFNTKGEFLKMLYWYLNGYIKNRFGTTSFSKKCNSLRMWSHYADSHKGFVIIFDRELLEATVLDGITKMIDVEYNGLPDIKLAYRTNNITIENDKYILTKKLKEWKYEKEVRIIRKDQFENDIERTLRFRKECILGIIYGTRLSLENCRTINNLVFDNNKKIKFFFAQKNAKRDNIIFKQIKYKSY